MKITWIGYYIDANEQGEAAEFPFRIDAELDEEYGFSGTVWEDEFYALSQTFVKVQGFIEGDHISFVKTYPFDYGSDEDGKVSIDKTKPGHDVVYDGEWDQTTKSWKGTWEIEIGIVEKTADYQDVLYHRDSFEMKEYSE